MRHEPHERGAALLGVLLLVAIMAVASAVMLERLGLATRMGANIVARDQARASLISAGEIAWQRIDVLVRANPTRITNDGRWLNRSIPFPADGGRGTITLRDGGNCFNLNSVVTGEDERALSLRPVGVGQFIALMQVLGVEQGAARPVADALADWIDSDGVPLPFGAEDDSYLRVDPPYRTANRFMTDPADLRAVRGVSPRLYRLLRPWICALPTADLSPVNINTLSPEQAPLLAMLLPGKLPVARAREIIQQRPRGGYDSTVAFWAQPALADLTPPPQVAEQTGLTSRWFRADIAIELGRSRMTHYRLFDARRNPVRVVAQGWGDETE